MYQVGINKGILLRCTAYRISRDNKIYTKKDYGVNRLKSSSEFDVHGSVHRR